MKYNRYFFSLFILLLMHLAANAQANKGEKIFSANLGLSIQSVHDSEDMNKTTGTGFAINPKLGFGMNNHWIVGGELGFGLQTTKSVTSQSSLIQKNTSDLFSAGIFARKFAYLAGQLGVFAEGEILFGSGTVKQELTDGNTSTENKSTVTQFGAAVRPGIFFRLNKKYAIESTFGNLAYSYTTIKPSGGGTKTIQSAFNFSLTNYLSLGFDIIF